MSYFDLLILALGVSMDACAVAICKGLALKKVGIKECVIVGAWFGGFQALMPTIGYFVGSVFVSYIEKYDHWVAFGLLALIGGNMIRESFSKEEEEETNSLGFKTMLLMAVATSVDALAIGVAPLSTAVELSRVPFSVISIGVTTFILSAVAVKIGNVFGNKYKSKAELAGGVILIILGLKVLLEGIGVIG